MLVWKILLLSDVSEWNIFYLAVQCNEIIVCSLQDGTSVGSAVQRAPEATRPGLLMTGQRFYAKIELFPISLNVLNVIAAIGYLLECYYVLGLTYLEKLGPFFGFLEFLFGIKPTTVKSASLERVVEQSEYLIHIRSSERQFNTNLSFHVVSYHH
jgi:hypothetical protein